MMIRINDREHDVVHESFVGIPTYVNEREFHAVAVRRDLSFHSGTVAGVTIVRQEQPVSIHIDHRNRTSTGCEPANAFSQVKGRGRDF